MIEKAISKTRKYYIGKIPFDWEGNLCHYANPGGRTHIDGKMYEQGKLYNYSYKGGPERKELTAFSFEQYDFKPEVKNAWGSEYIGTINASIWVDNYVFNDELLFDSFSRGRSAANLNFKSTSTNREYTVFLSDFSEYFVWKMVNGHVKADFTFCKKGQNFGLTIV